MSFKRTLLSSLLVGSGIIATPALANDNSELEALRALVQELDQKVRVLDRKNEIAAEEAAAKKKETPVVVAGDKGFGIKSADGNFEFKLRGLLQADNRTFFGDDRSTGVSGTSLDDEYLLRRVRPTFEGTVFGKYDFRFTPDFAPEAANVQDAYINARFKPWFKVQAGKFKVPYSLERLQGGGDLRFVERAYVANALLPNRDIGVQLHGDLFESKLNYAVGVFDGVAEGGSNASNRDNGTASKDKEFVARVFAEPFKGTDSVLAGLGFGLAAGTSDYKRDGFLNPQFRSPGQLTFFTYDGNVAGDGKQTRISPQFYYYYGPFGVMGEYARVKHDLVRGSHEDTVEHDGWQLAGSYVLTGEDNSFKSITPKQNFDLDKGQWGAWEVALRYTELNVDKDAFEGAAGVRFASAASTTESASSWAAGLNWYLNKYVKLQTTYEQTKFDSAFDTVKDRDTERVLFSRFQVAF
jgi:phosphate-selective porin OprO/OprP